MSKWVYVAVGHPIFSRRPGKLLSERWGTDLNLQGSGCLASWHPSCGAFGVLSTAKWLLGCWAVPAAPCTPPRRGPQETGSFCWGPAIWWWHLVLLGQLRCSSDLVPSIMVTKQQVAATRSQAILLSAVPGWVVLSPGLLAPSTQCPLPGSL